MKVGFIFLFILPNISRLRDSTVCLELRWIYFSQSGKKATSDRNTISVDRISTMSPSHAAVNQNRNRLIEKQTNVHNVCYRADAAALRHCTCHLFSSTWVAAAKGLLQTHPHFFSTPYDVHEVTPLPRVGERLRNPPSSPFEETPDTTNVPLSLPASSHPGGHGWADRGNLLAIHRRQARPRVCSVWIHHNIICRNK